MTTLLEMDISNAALYTWMGLAAVGLLVLTIRAITKPDPYAEKMMEKWNRQQAEELQVENERMNHILRTGELMTPLEPRPMTKEMERFVEKYDTKTSQEAFDSFRKQCEPGAKHNNDKIDQRPSPLPGGTTSTWLAACEEAIWQGSRYSDRLHLEIKAEGDGYRWQLHYAKGEVELPRLEAGPIVVHKAGDPLDKTSVATPSQMTTDLCTAEVNRFITQQKENGYMKSAKGVSDGYHTFQELYDMRLALTVAAFKNRMHYDRLWAAHNGIIVAWVNPCYRSRLHHDGTMFEGMFIVGITTDSGKQITFHYHDEHWDKFFFARTLKQAPEWDGHTDKDAMERLLHL